MKQLYALLLHLFPRSYRNEYGHELQTVFSLSLDNALKIGKLQAARVVFRELITFPGAVVYEHMRERRKRRMGGSLSSRFEFSPGSRSETLAALAPLLFVIVLTGGISMLFSSIAGFPVWLGTALAYLLIGVFFILLLVGLVKGLPRWSMPYLGLLLALFSVYIFSEWIYAYYGIFDFYERSWVWGALVNQAYMWSGLIAFVLLVVMASAILPVLQSIRRDWTLLCFLVYGTAPFAVLLAFDDYLWAEPYTLLALFVQALGVWFYLHASGKWKRFLILFAGLTLSMWMVGVSKVILSPSQPWFRGNALDWWGPEMLSPVIMWVWLTVSMLLPSVIHFFPKLRKPVLVG